MLRDFEFKLDYRITLAGNSEINYRSVVVPELRRKGRLFLAVREQVTRVVGGRPPVLVSTIGETKELAALATDDWNAVHLSIRGNVLAHMLNGRVMSVTFDDDAPNRSSQGLIGMQVHVGPPMKVEYRNIPLKEWEAETR